MNKANHNRTQQINRTFEVTAMHVVFDSTTGKQKNFCGFFLSLSQSLSESYLKADETFDCARWFQNIFHPMLCFVICDSSLENILWLETACIRMNHRLGVNNNPWELKTLLHHSITKSGLFFDGQHRFYLFRLAPQPISFPLPENHLKPTLKAELSS